MLRATLTIMIAVFITAQLQAAESYTALGSERIAQSPPPREPTATSTDSMSAAVKLLNAGNFADAMPVLQRLAAGGDAIATYKLGELYYRGLGVTRDPVQAARLYESAAERNVMQAQQNIAVMYLRGDGVTKNPERAVYWFRMAASQGDSFAQLSLGYRYKFGEGVETDYQQAMEWFRKAAEQNLPQAFYEVGMLYAEGKGVGQDFREAAAWTRRAADAAYAPAQYNLGVAFATGQGVKKNPVQAYTWFTLAVENSADEEGRRNANAARDRVGRGLSRAQVERAKSEARRWTQEHVTDTKIAP